MTSGPSSTALQKPLATHGPAPGRRSVRWTRGRKALFAFIGLGASVIAGVGFVGSYSAVRRLAVQKGFGAFAPVFPLGVDLGIAVLLALDLALTALDLKYPLLRYIAWLLTAATITFNAASSWPDALGSAMHATIPLLFIAVTEAMRNAIAKATAIESDQHMDSIRLARWFLAPISTFGIWRDMKLWEIRAYSVALERYQEKMALRQDLRAQYGRRWRKKATAAQLRPLRQARIGRPVSRPSAEAVAAAPSLGAERVLDPVPEPVGILAEPQVGVLLPVVEPAGERTPFEEQVVAQPDRDRHAAGGAEPEPGTADPLGGVVPEPRQEEWAEVSADRWAEELPAAAEVLRDPAGDEEGPDAEDDELADVEEPKVDLGIGPPDETKSQRAERIYLAHQRAGVELTKPNLARWAGYQQEGSGRTQYKRLEKKYGPIMVREGADQLDIDWQREPVRGAGARSLQAA
ncbi:MAG: DUF2637 domain-containing protein [Streptomycetaceae bacterium]|nr:DUF2637 domain-containing protein [Streptomycetaceae bacterium]